MKTKTMDSDHQKQKRSRWKQTCHFKRTNSCENIKLYCVLFLCCVFHAIDCIQYTTPEDCEWKTSRPDSQDVEVFCHLPTISSGVQRTNFTFIQSEYTSSLTIVCDHVLFESHLENSSLSHLTMLKILKIKYCKIASINAETFHGLNELRELQLRTYNNEWGAISLNVEEDTFGEQKYLEVLDLGYNDIISLPVNLFCGLSHLKVLNLTRNQLEDVEPLFSKEPQCLRELLKLDLSYNKLRKLESIPLNNLRVLNLHNNQLQTLSETSVRNLKKLQQIRLNDNQLKMIPENFFSSTTDIKEIYIHNNSLKMLPANCFGGLQQLLVLNLSQNHLTSEQILPDTFSDLIRLVVLDLSYNHLTKINSTIFQSQYSLQKLLLDHNQIEWAADNTFSALYNLHTLTLANNQLKSLDGYTLNGLYVLNILDLQENQLSNIHQDSFKNCSSVQTLNLSGNQFESVPTAVSSLHFLKFLDLTNNTITDITNSSLQNLKHLHTLLLSRNDLGNLTRGIFRDTLALKHVDFSNNQIQNLAHGMFDDAMDLEVITLNDNLLLDINGLFMNLHMLDTLNVSRNKITWFDYALVPHELLTLDLHDNELETLGNYFELETQMKLEYLDVSHNMLKEITATSFPHSIQILRLNNNQITSIKPFTFMPKANLTSVNLAYNQIRNLDMNSFRLTAVPPTSPLPNISIAGNPFYCDCTMEWLQRINSLDVSRQYPKIVDMEDILCQFPFTRHHISLPLSKANTSDFLCNYKSHCFALCHCCEFDACDCEMVCPENCTCYADQTWNTNSVDCSAGNYTIIPSRIPMDVTELYLDGNNIIQLTSHTFIGRKNMGTIYLNNSNIQTINNRTFNGLIMLKSLYLDHNRLTVLQGFEFETLVHLKELYLDHNEIATITNTTFVPLKSLETLHLHNNHIVEYQLWMLSLNRHLVDIRLSFNAWSCNCQYMEDFYDWLQTAVKKVQDVDALRCSNNHTHGLLIRQFNSSILCKNSTSVTYFQAIFVEDYMSVMIAAPFLLLLVVFVVVMVCIYKKEMKVWFFSKYGVRLFHRKHYTPENEKLFDAFVSYCKKDEAFIAQILAPELEFGSPPYRLCLRYRDLPTSAYVAEAITEAIECSHRTIVVLSEQFLKSEWCRFELKTSHRETQRNSKHKLVIVLLDKLSFKEMDPDARICFSSSPVIRWGDKRFWEKLRYSLPDGRIVEPKNFHQFPSPSNSVKLV